MCIKQTHRLTSTLNLGNALKGVPSLPSRISSIIAPEDEQIKLFIQNQNEQAYSIVVNKSCSVEDLAKKIAKQHQEDFQYISFQQRLMHKNNTIYDQGLYDSCLIKLRKNVNNMIKITIKFYGSDHCLTEMDHLSHRCEIISLKIALQPILRLCAGQIDLFDSRCNVLEDDKSLADYGIYKSCTLFFKPHFVKGVAMNSNIFTRDEKGKLDYIAVDKLSRDSQIISIDLKTSKKLASKNCEIVQFRSKFYNKLQLKNGIFICFIGCCYFYTMDRGWVIFKEGSENSLQIGDKILLYNKQYSQIQNISYDRKQMAQQISYSIKPSKNSPFFINDILISQGKLISFLYQYQYSKYRYLHLDVHESTTISQLKLQLKEELNISLSNRLLYSSQLDQILTDDTIIKDLESTTIYISLLSSNISEILKGKKVVLIFDQEIKQIKINEIKDRSIKQIIQSCYNQKIQQCPYYGVLFRGKLIDTHQKIKQFYQQHMEDSKLSQMNLLITRFPEKIKFEELLKRDYPQRSNTNIFERLISIFSENTDPILKYLTNHNQQETHQILQNLHSSQYQNRKNESYLYISELTKKLKTKQSYFKTCYRVSCSVIQDRFIKDNVVSIRQFFSCSSNLQKANSLFGGQRRNMLLHIKSITGKVIRKQGENKQIVFLPYTYFLVTKKQKTQRVIHVYLSQLPIPTTFHENIVVWVDDCPQNNIEIISNRGKFHANTEVVLLTSTELAKYWFYHFGKVINQLKIKLRLITDMVRYEQTQSNIMRKNYEAGIDLIEYLFNQCGYTTPVLVFCSDFRRGKQNLKRRDVDPSRYCEVTNIINTVYKFLNFDKI